MTNLRLTIACFSAIMIFAFIFPSTAQAGYLDPGSGSFFAQLVIATIVGGLISVKLFWKNIKENITSIFRKREN
jgi:hypothetical protein